MLVASVSADRLSSMEVLTDGSWIVPIRAESIKFKDISGYTVLNFDTEFLHRIKRSYIQQSSVFPQSTLSSLCCLKGLWVHPYIVIPANLAPDFGIWVTCGVKMMPLHHGWGWHPPQPGSHIHSRQINMFEDCFAVSRAYGCTLILLY